MIQLYSGVYFDPLNPDPALITIEDIAHALSLQCRYAGHCRYHYSVAQHCCLVHDAVNPHLRRWALLHDADEGLGLPDLPTLVKRDPRMAAYREAQAAIMRAVVERFGLDPATCPPEVDLADRRMLATEWKMLKLPGYIGPDWPEPYHGYHVYPVGPTQAKDAFLTRWGRLK